MKLDGKSGKLREELSKGNLVIDRNHIKSMKSNEPSKEITGLENYATKRPSVTSEIIHLKQSKGFKLDKIFDFLSEI